MATFPTTFSIVTPPNSPSFKVKKAPIFAKTTLIGTVFSFALTAVLITLTILTSKNFIALNLSALECSVGILGGSQVIGFPLLLIHRWNEKQLRKQNRRLYFPPNHPETKVIIPKLLPPIPSSKKTENNPKTENKPNPLKRTTFIEFQAYNLENPGQPIVKSTTAKGFFPLPFFGTYQSGNQDSYHQDLNLMTVRLPPDQLDHFPQAAVQWLQDDKFTDKSVECFFMVFDNRSLNKSRNIALHGIAIPDDNAPGVWQSSSPAGGHKKNIYIYMYDPIGVHSHTRKGAISEGNKENKGAKKNGCMTLHIHDGLFSPNNCSFEIDTNSEVASTYFATKMVDKVVVIHALFLNRESGEGQKLIQALNQSTIENFLSTLQSTNFSQYAQVQKTLQVKKK